MHFEILIDAQDLTLGVKALQLERFNSNVCDLEDVNGATVRGDASI
jgi:hypothetical protein